MKPIIFPIALCQSISSFIPRIIFITFIHSKLTKSIILSRSRTRIISINFQLLTVKNLGVLLKLQPTCFVF